MADRVDMKTIADAFKRVRFKKSIFGGLNQEDVWLKLEKIQQLYTKAYETRETELLAIIADREKMIKALGGEIPKLSDQAEDADSSSPPEDEEKEKPPDDRNVDSHSD